MMPVWTKFRNALRAFRGARGGNVAITFAFATLPIIATVGYAVDYSRANSVKVAMQAALDSTALMISKEAATDTPDQLQTNAKAYFLALFNRTDVKNITVNASYSSTNATQLVISGSVDVPTTLLAAVGWDTMTVGSSSTSKWGETRMRVALVLDNTGSMASSGKMTALIKALTSTNGLLTQLKNAATTNGDVYVSIIPFVKDVNLDPSNWNSDYIYWGTAPADNNVNNPTDLIQDSASSDNTSWNANNGACSIGNSKTRSSCANAGTCSLSAYTSQNSCTSATGSCSITGDTSQNSCTSDHVCSISGHNSQNGCTGAGTCSISGHNSQNGCTGAHACSISGYNSQDSCQSAHGTWSAGVWTAGVWTAGVWTSGTGTWTAAVWTPYAHNDPTHRWTGCVMDRGNPSGPDLTYNFDTNVSPVDLVTPRMSSLYAAEGPVGSDGKSYSCLNAAVMALSYNWTGMNDLVNGMSPSGNTNQAIGLQLGWLSLVGGGPFPTPPAMDPNYNYTQVIILLTDGLNTQNRWSTSQTSIDTREQLTCNNFKAAGSPPKITNMIYTIQVNTDNEPTSTLLQNCASNSKKFFLLTSADQIMNVFTQIGTELSQLRIAQ